jgi:aerobic C4-dicarboxylate transport protein
MSTISAAAPIARKPLYTSLFVQVLVALLLGIVLGMAAPDFAIGLKIFSDAFLKLISMIVAPIVFCVVVHGIAGAGDLKKVGRVGVKALIYFEVMTTIALVVGLLLAYLFGPGHGMNIDPATLDGKALTTVSDNAHKLQGGGIGSFLLNIIPTTSFDALARAMTCCRCCSSRFCSASASLWSAAKRASASIRSSMRYRPCCSARWG